MIKSEVNTALQAISHFKKSKITKIEWLKHFKTYFEVYPQIFSRKK